MKGFRARLLVLPGLLTLAALAGLRCDSKGAPFKPVLVSLKVPANCSGHAAKPDIIVRPGQSIQDAIGRASAGDLILVFGGVYPGDLAIDVAVTLLAREEGSVVIEGNVVLSASRSCLLGFRIRALAGHGGGGLQVVGDGNNVRFNFVEGEIVVSGDGNAVSSNTVRDCIQVLAPNNDRRDNTCPNCPPFTCNGGPGQTPTPPPTPTPVVTPPPGTPTPPAPTCGGVVCDDGNPCTRDKCEETGVTTACVFDRLNGPSCTDGNPCNGNEVCTKGECKVVQGSVPALGTCCGLGGPTDCGSVTCESTECLADLTCGQRNVTGGTCPGPPDDCVAYTCNNGECEGNPKGEGDPCGTGADNPCAPRKCKLGKCEPAPVLNGTSCGEDCKIATCSNGNCSVPQNRPDGTPCLDCKGTCTGGVCSASVMPAIGTPCGRLPAGSPNPCTDSCGMDGTQLKCTFTNAALGEPCGSPTLCSAGCNPAANGNVGACTAAVCSGPAGTCMVRVCNLNKCMNEPAANGTDCTVGSGAPACQVQECDGSNAGQSACKNVADLAKDGDTCGPATQCATVQVCRTGVCESEPANSGAPCSTGADLDECTVETCLDGNCTPGVAPMGTACNALGPDPPECIVQKCNGIGQGVSACISEPAGDGTTCTAGECESSAQCMGGMCKGTQKIDDTPCGATPCGQANPVNDCSCLSCQSGMCVAVNAPNGKPCGGAGNACDRSCFGGACTTTVAANGWPCAGGGGPGGCTNRCASASCDTSGMADNDADDDMPCGLDGVWCKSSCSAGICLVGTESTIGACPP